MSYVTLLSTGQVGALMQVFLAPNLEALGPDSPPTRWRVGNDVLVSVRSATGSGSLVVGGIDDDARLGPVGSLRLTWHDEPTGVHVDLQGLRQQPVDRVGLERMVFRALRRLLSVWLPSPAVLAPPESLLSLVVEGTQRVRTPAWSPIFIGSAYGTRRPALCGGRFSKRARRLLTSSATSSPSSLRSGPPRLAGFQTAIGLPFGPSIWIASPAPSSFFIRPRTRSRPSTPSGWRSCSSPIAFRVDRPT